MTSTLAGPRPTPLSRVWSGHQVIADDLQGEDLSDVLELHADASAWWVMPRSGEHPSALLRDAAAALELDDLTLRDLTAEDRRAKFEDLGGARLVLGNAVVLDPARDEVTAHPVSLVVTDRALICLADPPDGFDPPALLTREADALATGGVEAALRLLLASVVDSYARAVDRVEDATAGLADVVLAGRPLDPGEQLRALRLRGAVSQLRRLLAPMSAVFDGLLAGLPDADRASVRYWSALGEQHQRVSDAVAGLADRLAAAVDASLALADAQAAAARRRLSFRTVVLGVGILVSLLGLSLAWVLEAPVVGLVVVLVVALVVGPVLVGSAFRPADPEPRQSARV